MTRLWRATRRLALSEIGEEHANELHELDSDPRVMRYVGHGRPATRAEIDAVMRRVPRAYALYPGLGTWRATRRDNGDFVGWFALKYIPRTSVVEVGYRLRHAAWGRGYATEGARSLVEYGFDELGLYRIVGVTHPDNVASQRVLAKAGLADCGLDRVDAEVLLAHILGHNRAWLIAHADDLLPVVLDAHFADLAMR